MADIEKMENMISDEMMEEAAGGKSSKEDWTTVRCHVASGYLALRSKPEYKASNEIAKIYNGETLKVQGKLEEMKDTELRRYFSEDLQEIFGISPNDPAVRYLVLDTTEGRDGILLILAAAAVALLLIVVIIKKAKKKAPAPVAAAPAGADAPRPYDPEIR